MISNRSKMVCSSFSKERTSWFNKQDTSLHTKPISHVQQRAQKKFVSAIDAALIVTNAPEVDGFFGALATSSTSSIVGFRTYLGLTNCKILTKISRFHEK